MRSEIDKNKIETGLYIVSTPIGNLKDITLRAIDVLKKSDYIFCEDTRIAKKLLNYYDINSKLISNHKFNEKKNLEKFKEIICGNKIISLISDAGTPLISDPGKYLLDGCIKNNVRIIPIPGVSSVTTAVSISNFSSNFFFHGFIAEKLTQIEKQFSNLSKLECSIVFFISAKKINKIINLLKKYFKGRKIVFCKELTKFYEEFIRHNIDNLEKFETNLKGEITVVISEKPIYKNKSKFLSESDKILINELIKTNSVKNIVKILNVKNKVPKSKIYEYCIKVKNKNSN